MDAYNKDYEQMQYRSIRFNEDQHQQWLISKANKQTVYNKKQNKQKINKTMTNQHLNQAKQNQLAK